MAQRNLNTWSLKLAQEGVNQGLCPDTRVSLSTTPALVLVKGLSLPTVWQAVQLPAVLTSLSFPLHSQGSSAEEASGVTSEGNRPPFHLLLPWK